MNQLPDVIQALQTNAGFLLVAHGQSGDLGNAVQNNYNVAHQNIGNFLVDGDIQDNINSKFFYDPSISKEISPCFYGNLKKAGMGTTPVTRPVRRKVSRSGFFGHLLDSIFGYQIRIEERPEFQQVVCYEKSATLDTYLQSAPPQDAYFMMHQVGLVEPLRDTPYQRECPVPLLYVVGDQATIGNTVDYLKQNPTQYNDFMKALIPAQQFPITNRLIVDRLNNNEHVFLNLDRITQRIHNESLESICQRLGEK